MPEYDAERPDEAPEHDDVAFHLLLAPLRREPVRFRAGFRQAVMREVHEGSASTPLRAWRWITTPRMVPLRPATAALALAATLALVLLAWPRPRENAPAVTAAPVVTGPEVTVRLVFTAPQASRVAVTGDFAAWSPEGIPMRPVGDGRWVAELRLLPGVHHYVFVVDGTEWRRDPNAASQVDDGFGQVNSVLLVAEPRSS